MPCRRWPSIGVATKLDDERPLTFGFGLLALGGGGVNQPGDPNNPVLAPAGPLGQFVPGPVFADMQLLQLTPTASFQLTDRLVVGVGSTTARQPGHAAVPGPVAAPNCRETATPAVRRPCRVRRNRFQTCGRRLDSSVTIGVPEMPRSAKWLTSLAVSFALSAAGLGQGPAAVPPAEVVPPPGLPASPPRENAGAFETLVGRGEEERAEGDEIETDRDAFTPASSVVGRRRVVVESAYTFVDNRRGLETHSLPELLVRYGLTERVELRVGFNYEVGGGGNEVTASASGFSEPHGGGEGLERATKVSYGLKVRLTEQNGWRPRSAVILAGATPTGGSPGTTTATQLVATGVAGWELANRWRFDAAIRYGTASVEGERFGRWAPSAVLRVPVGERWGLHAEYFGVFSAGRPEGDTAQHYFSPGAHFLVTRNLEVGVRVGWGMSERSVPFFTNVGLGWRF